MKEVLKRNRLEIIVISVFFLVYFFYVQKLSIEMPYSTWNQQVALVDGFYSGTLTLRDILAERCGEHGLLGTNLLFLLNVRLFGFTTYFDVYLNYIIVLAVACLFVQNFRRHFLPAHRGAYVFTLVLGCAFLLSILQGTMNTMFTQVKLGYAFALLAMHMCNRVVLRKYTKPYAVATILVIILSMNVFGTLYSFAAIPGVFLIYLIRILQKRRLRLIDFLIALTYLLCAVGYLFEYNLLGLINLSQSGNLTAASVSTFKESPLILLTGLLAFLGNIILGYGSVTDAYISENAYYLVGLAVLLVFVYAIFRFFRAKRYKKTWLPLFLMCYTFSVYVLLSFGRTAAHGAIWMASTWYYLQTIPAAVGVIWILAMDCAPWKARSILSVLLVLAMTATQLLFAARIELIRAPYVRSQLEAKRRYCFAETIDDLPVDANGETPLQLTPEQSMEMIETLKKYNLNIYRYWDDYQAMSGTEKPNAISGVSYDGWMGTEATYRVRSGSSDTIVLSGYYPWEITGEEVVRALVDGKAVAEYTIASPSFSFDIPVGVNCSGTMTIEAPFARPGTPSDSRTLGFIITDISYASSQLITQEGQG